MSGNCGPDCNALKMLAILFTEYNRLLLGSFGGEILIEK
jgi:hypothetical protein